MNRDERLVLIELLYLFSVACVCVSGNTVGQFSFPLISSYLVGR